MKKLSYKEIERQRREEDILKTAEQLLRERGYGNLNMDELAETVGISKPTLYQHFDGKDAIALCVLMRSYQRMDEFLSRPLDEPAINRLIAMIRRSMVLYGPGNILGGLRHEMNPQAMWKFVQEHPQLTTRKQEFIQRLHTLVDQAKAEGAIEAGIPTPVVTHVLLALNRSLSDPTLQTEIANNPARLESAIESVIGVFLHGVTPMQASVEALHEGDNDKDSSPSE